MKLKKLKSEKLKSEPRLATPLAIEEIPHGQFFMSDNLDGELFVKLVEFGQNAHRIYSVPFVYGESYTGHSPLTDYRPVDVIEIAYREK